MEVAKCNADFFSHYVTVNHRLKYLLTITSNNSPVYPDLKGIRAYTMTPCLLSSRWKQEPGGDRWLADGGGGSGGGGQGMGADPARAGPNSLPADGDDGQSITEAIQGKLEVTRV